MKKLSTTVFLVFFLSAPLFGQGETRDLTITGSVLGVTAFVKKDGNIFEIEIYLQFKNNTNGPLIVFAPGNFDGTKKVTFQDALTPSTDSSNSAQLVPRVRSRYAEDPVSCLLYELRQRTPPVYTFAVIQPHGYYEARDKIKVRNGYKVETRPTRLGPFGKSSVDLAIPEYSALRVRYLVSSDACAELSDALSKANSRWRDVGTLLLNSSGNYDVTSEVILNKLTE